MAVSRKSYTEEKKLNIIAFAEIHRKWEASLLHNTDKRNIREWRKKKTLLGTMKKSTTAMRSHKEIWPKLEWKLENGLRIKKRNLEESPRQISNWKKNKSPVKETYYCLKKVTVG